MCLCVTKGWRFQQGFGNLFKMLITYSLWKILLLETHYLFADDSTLCRTIYHPSDRQAAASSLSADLGKITNCSNMWNMSFNPYKSHTLTMSLRKDSLGHTPPTFSTILWNKSFHSSFWVSLSAMIFPGKATFPSWPPKPVADWASSIVQSTSFAHLRFSSHTKLSSTA